MSTLSQFVAPTVTTQTVNVNNSTVSSYRNVYNVQSGYVNAVTMSSGSGIDNRYYDISISSVPNVAKVMINFVGGCTNNVNYPSRVYEVWTSGASTYGQVAVRMVSSNVLRVFHLSSYSYLWGRWQVLAYN